MYMDDIQILAQNGKKLETLILNIKIYSQDIGMEYVMLIMKKGKKRETKEGIERPN